MGYEALCMVRHGGRSAEGKALLESDSLIFRGPFRLKLPLKGMEAGAAGGELRVRTEDGDAVFVLGDAAAKWLHKIRNPPSLLDKLGVKPGQKVSVLGIADAAFAAELEARGADAASRARRDSDLIFLGVEKPAALDRLMALRESIQRNGAIWIVYPKGRQDITQEHVMAATKAAGLVDVKVAAFSATHTALKAVIPVAKR